ncbi:MAG: leucine-rich repeat protein [Clostridia bacterium]|nr:leucine-rich repeat protein [Clostridia bacterium]
MKRKLFLTFLLTLVVSCLLSIVAFAQSFTVDYSGKATETTDENGTITLKSEAVQDINGDIKTKTFTIKNEKGESVTVSPSFLGWYTDDGAFYLPGEKITLTEDTYLRQAEGVRVYDASGFTACTGYRYLTVMLEADITLTSTDSTEHTGNGAMTLINLNGHTITSTAKDAFGQHRSGLKLIGEGTINHTGTGYFFYTKRHGSFEEYQYFYVGKGVTINTAGTLFETTSDMTLTEGFPKVRIDGTVKAAALIKLAGASNASVVIGKTADITVTSNTFINSSLANDNNHINVAIEGGNFTVPQTVVWCDDISKYTYSITGGSFNVAPNGILNSGYEAVYDEATQLYVIRKSGCPVYENGEHNFIMGDVIPGYSAANCINGGYHVFECACGETYEKRVEALGHNCTEVSVLPAPQYGVTDITRKDCTRCNYFYYVNPQDAYFTMVYAAADGSLVEVTDVVSKFYNVTVTQSDDRSVLKVTGIKNVTIDGTTYGKANIVKLVIPSGTTEVSGIFSSYSELKEIVIQGSCNITFTKGSISSNSKLEKLVVLDGSTVTFYNEVSSNCSNFATIDVSRANATFNDNAFKGNVAIKNLILGSGNTYYFGSYSFGQSGLTQVVIPDDCTVTRLGQKCFAETQTIKYVYIGKNAIANKTIGDNTNDYSIFGGDGSLELVVLMDIELVNKWVFSVKTSGAYVAKCDLVIYSHAPSITFKDGVNSGNQSAFNDRNAYNVYIYSAGPVYGTTNGTAKECNFNTLNCKYTIYTGIGHAFEKKVISESNCTVHGILGYDTLDCTCGINYRDNTYKIFSSIDTSIEGEYPAYSTLDEELPLDENNHTVGDVVINIYYLNGMTEPGTRAYKCVRCDAEAGREEKPTCPPIFVSHGYSYALNGTASIMQGFSVKRDTLEYYSNTTGKSILYGLVVAIKDVVGTTDLIGADGKATHEKVACVDFDTRSYDMFEMRLVGLNEVQLDLEIYLCAYYVVDGGVYYIDNGVSGREAPVAITYNKVVAKVENGTEIETTVNKED